MLNEVDLAAVTLFLSFNVTYISQVFLMMQLYACACVCVDGWLLRLHSANSECTCVNDRERHVVFSFESIGE